MFSLNKLIVVVGLCLITTPLFAGLPPTQCREVDGTPAFTCYTLEFTNDSLTQAGTKGIIDVTTGGITDHGALTGLLDDDHTQYLLGTVLDTEAELETQLTDVTNVFTNNDGALNDDDVTLADVQAATTSDFHNIGGVDADTPALTQEQVEDFVGGVLGDGTGTHTGIAFTYQDATGDFDAIVDHGNIVGLGDDDHTQYQKETDFTAGSVLFRGASVITEDSANLFYDNITKEFGIGTNTPNAELDVRGLAGTSVGGFPSGTVHVTSASALINANAVITGHNLNSGNKQLWYLGSVSGSNDNIAFINRQNGSVSFSTNGATRLTLSNTGTATIPNLVSCDTIDTGSAGLMTCGTDADTPALTQEQVEDFAGALVADGTGVRTGIAITYQDATGDIDVVIDHDAANNFLTAEHVDWAGASAGVIHTTNVIDITCTDCLNAIEIEDIYLLNSGDTMAGTLTADGLTLGVNENITLGSQTFDHDGTEFVLDDDIQIIHSSDPGVRVTDTTNSVITGIISGDLAGQIGTESNHSMVLATNNLSRVFIDAAGGVAIGAISVLSGAFEIVTEATNDDPIYVFKQSTVLTTDATQAGITAETIAANNTYFLEAYVVARRTGGSAGTADDGAAYLIRAAYTTKSGTVTLLGSVDAAFTAEDQSAWDATLAINGSNVVVAVIGAVNNNITWHCTLKFKLVSS